MNEIPIFPLPLVIFPGGRFPLQIFESRYLDMVKDCLKKNTGFGITMIIEGSQTLSGPGDQLPSISHCGTYCRIVDFDQLDNGVLTILIEGQKKFVVRDHYEQSDRLMLATVDYLKVEEDIPVPESCEHLTGILESLMAHDAVRNLGLVCDYQQAKDVGARLTELLPCANQFKQRMLELKDPLVRLIEIDKLVERLQKTVS